MADHPAITIFACGRGTQASCTSCGARASTACAYPLRGARAGEACGRALCGRCAAPLGSATDEPLCPVHRRVREREVRGG